MDTQKKTIIFDLDGTLVNIEPIFFTIVNVLAEEFHFSPIRSEEIPAIKKLHLKNLIWKRLGGRIFFLPQILKRGREEYTKVAPIVPLFTGMKDILIKLHTQNCRIGIVSSSKEETIKIIIDKNNLPIDFFYHGKLFNKAQSLKEALKKEKLLLSETIYIGDEVRDIEACRKIGLDIISVSWGLNSKEALISTGQENIMDTPAELLTKLRID